MLMLSASCSYWRSDEPASIASRPTPQPDLPFEIREPEEFKAEIVTKTGAKLSKREIYKDGSRLRIDLFNGETVWETFIMNGRSVAIDHLRRVFCEISETIGGSEPDFAQDLTIRLLNDRKYLSFEEIGIENGLRIFRVSETVRSDSQARIYYDENRKLIVKQEISDLRGEGREAVRLVEVRYSETQLPDSIFTIPHEYRQISEVEYFSARR
ncbi:hypothetical protein [Leptolyngbya sp. 7M]|uniref:hypothetical protein n=1 Tax=Leptolyngbya sp. 7M TaxID=2812896 RepID=UPI001B8D21AA|nr:hypothetical protein [Leptolyngbya sp. 7M]QYO65420.1 hypothetical protein JVX88_01140 [Leptolyngbya sp. 7M]